jgi:hypothetical protein
MCYLVLQGDSSYSGYLGGDEQSLETSSASAGSAEESGTEEQSAVKVPCS